MTSDELIIARNSPAAAQPPAVRPTSKFVEYYTTSLGYKSMHSPITSALNFNNLTGWQTTLTTGAVPYWVTTTTRPTAGYPMTFSMSFMIKLPEPSPEPMPQLEERMEPAYAMLTLGKSPEDVARACPSLTWGEITELDARRTGKPLPPSEPLAESDEARTRRRVKQLYDGGRSVERILSMHASLTRAEVEAMI